MRFSAFRLPLPAPPDVSLSQGSSGRIPARGGGTELGAFSAGAEREPLRTERRQRCPRAGLRPLLRERGSFGSGQETSPTLSPIAPAREARPRTEAPRGTPASHLPRTGELRGRAARAPRDEALRRRRRAPPAPGRPRSRTKAPLAAPRPARSLTHHQELASATGEVQLQRSAAASASLGPVMVGCGRRRRWGSPRGGGRRHGAPCGGGGGGGEEALSPTPGSACGGARPARPPAPAHPTDPPPAAPPPPPTAAGSPLHPRPRPPRRPPPAASEPSLKGLRPPQRRWSARAPRTGRCPQPRGGRCAGAVGALQSAALAPPPL